MLQDSGTNIRWSPVMSVGVPALDSDHRCLIRIISLLHGVEDADETRTMIETALDTLKSYAWFHFQREERVLKALSYPEVAFHRAEHEAFARYLDCLYASFAGRAEQGLAGDLFYELAAWIRHHILIQDMTFKPHITDPERAEQIARAGTAACWIDFGGKRHRTIAARPLECPPAPLAH